MRVYGLLGYPLGHSFSAPYFTEKFRREGLTNCVYKLFPTADLKSYPALVMGEPQLIGLNVTIPHKEAIIPFLDKLDLPAAQIGAVNTVFLSGGIQKGFNTDYLGFMDSLRPLLRSKSATGLILGTGGASKAVHYVFAALGIAAVTASRNPREGEIGYPEIPHLSRFTVIVNCTPLGMVPDVQSCPPIRYEQLGPEQLLYDLIYNPQQTEFLKRGHAAGARIKNGLEMLHLQAEASWKIWNPKQTNFSV